MASYNYCNYCKNNITTTAIPGNLDQKRRFGLSHTISIPTNEIKIRVTHEHPECDVFEQDFARIWWQVLGKLLNLKLILIKNI